MNATTHVLLIEDEVALARVLRDYLEQAGFRVSVAYRGDEGLALFERERPDVVLLDLNLPGMDGLDVARAIRRQSNVPILMITARRDEVDQLIGLELGADDYIVKPFSPRLLLARLRAVLRRVQGSPPTPQRLRVGDLEIDLDAHTVTRAGEPIRLTPTEFRLLATMAQYPGRVFTRSQLLEALGYRYTGYERTIDAHIKNLRAKLEPDPKQPRYIETVFGVGYRLRKPTEA
ncbi:MAG: response regulator transcription factor [Chloroflexi bacterium]|nr:response regulator transcription factor [Chloroflexota bacterium]